MTAINKISRIDLAESSKSVSELLMRGNNNLDLIRLLAALMVVFGHSFALSLTQNLTEPFSYLFPFTYSGSIAVKVFFFISGLLVTNSILTSRSIKKFIISRFFRIYPAFAVTIIITGLIIGPLAYRGSLSAYITDSSYLDYIINSLRFKTPYFIKGVFVGNHDNGSMNGSLWTIGLEVSAYLVVIAAFILAGLKNRQLSSCLCLLIIIIPLTNIEGLNFIVIKSSEAYLLPSCFALGALFAINKDNIILDYKIPLALYIIYKTSHSVQLSQFAFYAATCTFFLYISTLQFIKSIKIKYDISYGIYLWSFPVQQLIAYYWAVDTINMIIYSVILSILMGVISFILIEKPAMKISKSLINNI